MTVRLTPGDIRFEASCADPSGRVFHWQNGVYRAISHEQAPAYRRLLDDPRAERLFAAGLVRTEVAPLELAGYALVLKHHRVPFVSYGLEWCGPMLRDAAVMLLDLNIELAGVGLELQDGHVWNVLFDGCRPQFVDFGSIVPVRSPLAWGAADEFCRWFVAPLMLMARGLRAEACRMISNSDDRTPWPGWRVAALAPWLRRPGLYLGAELLRHRLRGLDRMALLRRLREIVAGMELPSKDTEWSGYGRGVTPPEQTAEMQPKAQSVLDVLARLRPATVLDIGCNAGWFSKLAAMQGCRVVALDADEMCVRQLYLDETARRQGILPLVMDFRNPTPQLRPVGYPPAAERLRCDLAMALALVHHLVFKQGLTFDQIAEGLSALADRRLLVEFIPREDRYVAEWYNQSYSWYSPEKFAAALRLRFRSVEQLPSSPPPRIMFLCER